MSDSLHPEHQDLLQFLYQFPVGVIAMDEQGVVGTMNPAAANLLSPEVRDGESVMAPMAILQRLVPELIARLGDHPTQMGMVSTDRGQIVDCRDGVTRFSVTAHRLRTDHIIFSLTDVTEERRILNAQRERAERLQRALLGVTDPTRHQVGVAYLPAHREDLSGGDWCDVIEIDFSRVALVVGDVVGHDIEASATMGQLRSIVRAFALDDADPVSVLARTDTLAQSIDGADFASIHYAVLNQATSSVTYASAGHPPPLLIRSGGSSELLAGGRRSLLTISGPAEARNASAQLTDGDVIVMYTDGLVERAGEPLGVGFQRLEKAASNLPSDQSMEDLVNHITKSMLVDSDRRDDVCVLAVRYRSAGSQL